MPVAIFCSQCSKPAYEAHAEGCSAPVTAGPEQHTALWLSDAGDGRVRYSLCAAELSFEDSLLALGRRIVWCSKPHAGGIGWFDVDALSESLRVPVDELEPALRTYLDCSEPDRCPICDAPPDFYTLNCAACAEAMASEDAPGAEPTADEIEHLAREALRPYSKPRVHCSADGGWVEELGPPPPRRFRDYTVGPRLGPVEILGNGEEWLLAHGPGLSDAAPDVVNHPPHYTQHPSGVECIQITEHMNFCRGNAVKYIWRAGDKGDEIEDLKKARWYVDREIARLERIEGGGL